jgi:hypothetical protein
LTDSGAWNSLPRSWRHVPLPRYREAKDLTTYEAFEFEDLPPIPIELDEDCAWLLKHGTEHEHGLSCYERDCNPATVEGLANGAGVELPRSFFRFMCSPALQSRVVSVTDCYLDPGERIVETVGSIPGRLIHFLSDSQSCLHWYLHIVPRGGAAVLISPDLYCHQIENSDWMENPSRRLEAIDLAGLEFTYCARSFSDFLYRFWIENEIWVALGPRNRRKLKPLELEYVNHYASNGALYSKLRRLFRLRMKI